MKKQQPNNSMDSHMIHMTCDNKLFAPNVAGMSVGRQFALLQCQLLGCLLEGGHCWEGSCGLLSVVYNAKGGLHCWEGSCGLLHFHMPRR